MQTIRITTSQNIDIDYELGGLGERIVARLIDLAIFFLVFLASIIAGFKITSNELVNLISIGIYAALFVFYDLACEIFMNGQSVGKKVMKIRVMSLDGAQPRISQYLLRWLFRIIDFGIGFGAIALVVAAISDNVQRIGDLVAGTITIRTEPRTNLKHVAYIPPADGYEPVFESAGQLSEQDIELINEVINAYVKTGNSDLVYNMVTRIKEHLGVTPLQGMNDMRFLQTILKDYNYQVAQGQEL